MPGTVATLLRHPALGRLLPLVLVPACVFALFRDALVDGRVYVQDDTVTYYAPLGIRVAQALAHGRLPLWTPYIYAGHPLLADSEAAVLYPPNVAAWLLLEPGGALVATRVTRHLLAAFFTYAFGRSVGLSRPAGTLAGLSFALGSFMVGQLHHKNLADAALWLPLVLCLLERGFQATGPRRWRFWLLAGLAQAAQLLTIHVNPVLMTGLMVGAYVLARLAGPGEPRVRPGAAAAALGLVFGLGGAAAAVQLAPLYELSTHSFRGRPVPYDFATAFAPPPHNLLTLVFPYFFRDPATGLYWSPWFRWNTTLYAGAAPLLLAVVAVVLALVRRGDVPARWVAFFAGVFGAALLLALGENAPVNLYGLVWQLPVFSSTRVPARFLFLALFALAVLAGFGLDGFRRAPSSRLRPILAVLTGAILAVPALLLAARRWALEDPGVVQARLLGPYLALRGQGIASRPPDPFAALLASLDPVAGWTGRALLLLGLTLGVLWLWCRLRRAGALCASALVLLAAADLVLFARDLHPRSPAAAVAEPGPAARFLVEQPGLHRVLTLWPVWETVPNRLLPLRVFEAGGYSSLIPDRQRQYMAEAERPDERLLDLLGVRYLVVGPDRVPPSLSERQPVFRDEEVVVFERPTHLPRVLLVGGVVLADGAADALRRLAAPAFDPRRTAVVEDPAALAHAAAPDDAPAGRAEIAAYAPERVVVWVDAARPAFLVLADAYYPGWRARVDGRRRPLYRANHLFRAVPVPAGAHEVVFTFEPGSVRLGAAVSAGALLLAAAGLCATWLWGRLASWLPDRTREPTASRAAP